MSWGQSNINDISVETVDAAFDDYLKARDIYEGLSKESKAAHKVMLEYEWKLQEMLEQAGKTSWSLDGRGKVSSYENASYATPKTVEDKRALAQYISEGKGSFWEMFSVNSRTLNAWAKQEFENGVKHIPGLAEPTVTKKIKLTRSK